MHNQNPEIVKFLFNELSWFQCKKCGKDWIPKTRPGGEYYKKSWQCPNRCKPKDKPKSPAERLTDNFVRGIIKKGSIQKDWNIPQELVDAHRILLIMNRELMAAGHARITVSSMMGSLRPRIRIYTGIRIRNLKLKIKSEK